MVHYRVLYSNVLCTELYGMVWHILDLNNSTVCSNAHINYSWPQFNTTPIGKVTIPEGTGTSPTTLGP